VQPAHSREYSHIHHPSLHRCFPFLPLRPQEGEKKYTIKTNNPLHLSSRHPRLALFGLTAAGVALAIKYNSDNLAKNERAQRSTNDPNYYVSVDRSGGGV
jgi:hypothetical protein